MKGKGRKHKETDKEASSNDEKAPPAKKDKKLKGKGRKDKETDKVASSNEKVPPAKNLKETSLSNEELDDLTDIEWPEECKKMKTRLKWFAN